MPHDRQYFIDRARQKKADALTETILSQYPGHDVEALIERLTNYTGEEWSRLARLARCNTPSLATCQIVFSNLRAQEKPQDRQPARRTFEEMKALTDSLF